MKILYITISLIVFALGIVILMCFMSSSNQPTYSHNYKKALQNKAIDIEKAGISAEWVGQQFDSVMNHFKSPDVVDRAIITFASEIYFNDTWHTHETPQTLGNYLKRTGEKVYDIDIQVDDVVVRETNAYVRWSMSIIVNEGDKPISSVGMTHLRFDENRQIVTYQDYWDGVEGFYRTLPIIGGALEILRKKLG